MPARFELPPQVKRFFARKEVAVAKSPRESGSIVVEFALTLLPLFAFIFMTLDVSWLLLSWACIQEGAREGVRYAVTCSGQAETTVDSAVKTTVVQYSFGFAQSANVSVDFYPSSGYSSSGTPTSIDGDNGSTAVGNIVKVTVQNVTFKSFAPIFHSSTPFVLSASASDVMQ